MIQFSCPNCGRSMKAQDEYAGKNGQCKQCGQNVTVPFPVLAATAADLITDQEIDAVIPAPPQRIIRQVSCPYCDEMISPGAKKCRHCGEFLEDDPQPKGKRSRAPDPSPAAAVTVVNNLTQTTVVGRGGKRHSRFIAFFLSCMIPGLGQLYAGKFFDGMLWFCLTVAGYFCFVFPGVILHIICPFAAASIDPYR